MVMKKTNEEKINQLIKENSILKKDYNNAIYQMQKYIEEIDFYFKINRIFMITSFLLGLSLGILIHL